MAVQDLETIGIGNLKAECVNRYKCRIKM